ncbi:GNAT family N-acetyltransferase [Chitinimonas sp.]|uniref:GNAT family N-acetyltransferase n=1 Tax=Chitinimonas sp. TaxID=1934313 RepID=UPI002F954F44
MTPMALQSATPRIRPMPIELKPYDPTQAEQLARWHDQQPGYEAELGETVPLADAARGNGRQALVAWQGGTLLGYVGWVLLGVPQDGCAYGSPLVASDIRAATLLVDAVRRACRQAGASRLRISARQVERTKRQALEAAGFTPLFDFVHLEASLPLGGLAELPNGLRSVPFREIDWSKAQACYAETFAGVPNAPTPEVDVMQEEWSQADWRASCVLADDVGDYQAFLLVTDGEVDAVGVRAGWRGRELAAILYRRAGPALLAQGITTLRSMVASTNHASLGLHRKLGFCEHMPAWTVYEAHL